MNTLFKQYTVELEAFDNWPKSAFFHVCHQSKWGRVSSFQRYKIKECKRTLRAKIDDRKSDKQTTKFSFARTTTKSNLRSWERWTKFVWIFFGARQISGSASQLLVLCMHACVWEQYECNHSHCCKFTLAMFVQSCRQYKAHTHTYTHTRTPSGNNLQHEMQMWFSVCKSNNLFCILAIYVEMHLLSPISFKLAR